MNYLNLKKQFPKSLNVFFSWVSDKNPKKQNAYVDNVYFRDFFSENFEYLIHPGALVIDNEKKYFIRLQNDLKLHSDNSEYKHLFSKNKIRFGEYSDTNEEYIIINIESESSFDSAFFVLEILIENEFYVE